MMLNFSTNSIKTALTSLKYVNKIMNISCTRFLYCKTSLGLDSFEEQKIRISSQMTNIADKFKEKMKTYIETDSKSMVFTEDLKNMLHLSSTDDDVDLIVKMIKKFNQQNKQLRFGTYIFGPVVMRLFYLFKKPDLALECFKSEEFSGFFDQLITYQILLDLLYENGRYQDVLDAFEQIRERQIEGTKYPKNSVVLVLAACYKINSKESLEYALKLWNDMMGDGHFPMRRAVTFCAGLALNNGKPDICLEILATAKNQNYMTIRNLRAVALTKLGRIEDVIPILKAILTNDSPLTSHTFNKDVLETVREAVEKSGNPEFQAEFNRLYKIFEAQSNISNLTLDEQLCSEIQAVQRTNNQQTYRYPKSNQIRNRNKYTNYRNRPGLQEIV